MSPFFCKQEFSIIISQIGNIKKIKKEPCIMNVAKKHSYNQASTQIRDNEKHKDSSKYVHIKKIMGSKINILKNCCAIKFS